MAVIEEEIRKLCQRTWQSPEQLIGAIRLVVGETERFDCLEEWKGQVIIRRRPVGETGGFEFRAQLERVATELAA